MNRISLVAVGLVALGGLACGSEDEGEKNQAPGEASALYDKIKQEDYRNWTRAPGYDQRQPSNAPHGAEVEIYVNSVMSDALAGPALTTWPEGSIVAKDGWDGSSLKYVAIMERRASGWFFVELDGGGSVLYSGTPSTCTGCHSGAADGILAFNLPSN